MATETQIVREAPEIEAYKLGLLQAAKAETEKPLTLPAYQAAGLSELQKKAVDLGQQGIGVYAPFLQQGAASIGQGQQLTQAGAQGISGINVAPQYQTAQQALQAGLGQTAGLGALAQQAGVGMGAIGAGTGQVAQAGQLAGQYMGAQYAPSEAMLQQAATAARGGAGQYSPGMAAAFMNPYQAAVTEKALGEMRRQADIARQGQAAQAVRAGAFGGTREGVQRAEFERGIQDVMGQRIMQDYAQNYAQAQQAAQQSFEAQRQRQLALSGQLAGIGGALGQQAAQQAQLGQSGVGLLGQLGAQQAQLGLLPSQLSAQQANIIGQQAGLYGQLGQGIGGLAAQQAGIGLQQGETLGRLGAGMGTLGIQQAGMGQTYSDLAARDVAQLGQLGTLQAQAEQARLDAIRATELQKATSPYQRLGFLSDIYKGAPTSQMSLTSATSPTTSPLLQAVGLGISGLSAAAGASKAGLFG
jgi:hypothetical protein